MYLLQIRGKQGEKIAVKKIISSKLKKLMN